MTELPSSTTGSDSGAGSHIWPQAIGSLLRLAFATAEDESLPPIFADLLERMGKGEKPVKAPPRNGLTDAAFKAELSAVIPKLRIYARSISGSVDLADDLVQETMLKAWAARARFEAGTNMRAWTSVILRNHYLSEMRRNRFKGDYDEASAEALLAQPSSQEGNIDLMDANRAMMQLPPAMREALILVGANGMAYEEAAAICNCAVGTIKSRVARGRAALEALLDGRSKMPSHQGG